MVDPRETRWEVERPAYRVQFWSAPDSNPHVAPHSTTYEITDTDVLAVLDWVTRTRGDRVFVLYVVCRQGGELGQLRLAGQDPTASDPAGVLGITVSGDGSGDAVPDQP
ncbi:hypothetical protein [Frankia sp. AgB32]|uniref:hypothetical protein n=1 Tax=Frankia sp. AgB32 TaxID=631119 RepID=UPI00200ED4EA|nr:hypothetical protein [Frankia sp. AgB32]MCK9893745.1 hypothetical protein [Frankia sp. AgB32]